MKTSEFESIIGSAKENLEKLSSPELGLSEGMAIYKDGIKELKKAQKMLEHAKLEYEEIKKSSQEESGENKE